MGDPLTWYEALRSKNPAPHAAYLKLEDVAILCSSPERFLSIDATTRRAEARPFKGTAARYGDATQDLRSALTLQNCVKSNAENLMIAVRLGALFVVRGPPRRRRVERVEPRPHAVAPRRTSSATT